MIYVDDMLHGDNAVIGDDYIDIPGVGSVAGITDWGSVTLRDDSNGAEITNAVLAGLRHKRNVLLTESDWTQVADAPLSDEPRAAWRAYRQALRDLPETAQLVPGGIQWPGAPAQHREEMDVCH
ncbi:MAG: tail fiber assembly protein [Eubacteriales bacterium]|nr:tail fiber assembly protein [Eubacteriales bacterium]